MDIIKVELDGKTFRMFNLEIKGVPMNIAEENLDQYIENCIENERYHKVQHIDETYPFVVAQCIADLEDEDLIREEIEAIIDADGGVESFDWIYKYQNDEA